MGNRKPLRSLWIAVAVLLLLAVCASIAYAFTWREVNLDGYLRLGSMRNGYQNIVLEASTGDATIAGTLSATTQTFGSVVANTTGTQALTVSDSGKFILATKNDGTTTVSVPDPAATTVGAYYYIAQSEDQDLKITTATGDDTDVFITLHSQDSDYITFSTASEKIGAAAYVVGVSATKWLFVPLQGTATVTDTD